MEVYLFYYSVEIPRIWLLIMMSVWRGAIWVSTAPVPWSRIVFPLPWNLQLNAKWLFLVIQLWWLRAWLKTVPEPRIWCESSVAPNKQLYYSSFLDSASRARSLSLMKISRLTYKNAESSVKKKKWILKLPTRIIRPTCTMIRVEKTKWMTKSRPLLTPGSKILQTKSQNSPRSGPLGSRSKIYFSNENGSVTSSSGLAIYNVPGPVTCQATPFHASP